MNVKLVLTYEEIFSLYGSVCYSINTKPEYGINKFNLKHRVVLFCEQLYSSLPYLA